MTILSLRAILAVRSLRSAAALLLAALLTPALGAPGDYNATTGYGVFRSSLDSLLFEPEISAATLDSEFTEPDGRKRLSFHFTLRNSSGGYFEDPAVFLNASTGLPWMVEMVTPAAEAPDLPPGTSLVPAEVTTTAPLTFLIAAADAEAAKTALLAREQVHISAMDLYRFNVPITAADAAMDVTFTNASSSGDTLVLDFGTNSPVLSGLAPGTLLVHNPAVYELRNPAYRGELVLRRFLTDLGTAEEAAKQTGLQTRLLQVSSVSTNGETGVVTLTGTNVVAVDQMISAYCKATHLDGFIGLLPRDPWNPPLATSFHTADEKELRTLHLEEAIALNGDCPYPPAIAAELRGLFNLHYPFNDVEIAPGVMVDGEVLFKGLSFQMEGQERNDQRNQWAYRLSNRLEITLRLTAEEGVEILDLEKTLLQVPLPTIVIPMFQVPVTIQPIAWVKIGASADAGARLQVPIHSSVDAGIEMAYDGNKPEGSRFTFKPFAGAVPMQLSSPSLGEAIQVDASAWAELGLDLLLQNTLGPGISVRATGDLAVRPLANPWWTLDGDLDLRGRFAINLFGIPLLTEEAPQYHLANLFHLDPGGAAPAAAGAGLAARSAGSPGSPTPLAGVTNPLYRAEGGHIRWARAARWTSLTPYDGRACRVRGTAEDVYVVMNSAYPNTTLMRVTAQGDLAWTRSIGETLQHVAGTLDGGVIVAGGPGGAPGVRVLKYDGVGTLLWDKMHLMNHSDTNAPQLYVAQVLARDIGGGTQELHIAGWRYRNLNSRQADPFLYRCDGDGNVLGVRSFDSPDYVAVHGIAYTPDNGLIWSGMCQQSPDGSSFPGPGVAMGGWLMKTDLEGNLQWSKMLNSSRGNYFNSVAVSPDGRLYTCGFLGTVLSDYGSMQLTRHEPDGTLLSAVTLCEATDGPTVTDYAAFPSHSSPPLELNTNPGGANGDFADWLPNSGRTLWDEGRRIVWTPNGLVVISTTGLSSSRAATIACLTEELRARWYTAHERGGSEESLFDILPTAGGLLGVGSSATMLDFATHSSATSSCAVLLKLPLEGKCDFHPGAGVIHRYLQPGFHDHVNNEMELGSYQPSISGSLSLTCTVVSATTSNGAALFPHQFLTTPMTYWVPLERGDENRSATYAQWADYWNLPADSQGDDPDNDGRSNGQEWFFGGNPATPDSGRPPFTIARNGDNGFDFTFTKSHTADLHAPRLEGSTNLLSWIDVVLPTLTVTPLDPYTDEIGFTLPLTGEWRQFFRITAQ